MSTLPSKCWRIFAESDLNVVLGMNMKNKLLILLGCMVITCGCVKTNKNQPASIPPQANAIVSAINDSNAEALLLMLSSDANETVESVEAFLDLAQSSFGKITITGNWGDYEGAYISHSIGYDYPNSIRTYEIDITSDKFKESVLVLEKPLTKDSISLVIIAGKLSGTTK